MGWVAKGEYGDGKASGMLGLYGMWWDGKRWDEDALDVAV
jgi:hypothetical protein